jgi:hypothetical protein
MPTCFRFMKAVKLPKIDNEICEFLGVEASENIYSSSYDFVVLSGMSILRNDDVITEETIDEFCDRVHEGQFKELLKEFLVKRYKFEAWWEGK